MKTDKKQNPALSKTAVMVSAGSLNKSCNENIHWYVGKYINGKHYYNQCAYCRKRQSIELD
jgi:hypothetical protein